MKENEVGLLLPENKAMELGLLSALVFQPTAYFDVNRQVSAEMFTDPRYRLAFRAVESLNGKDEPVDMLTIENEMQRLDPAVAEQAGGLAFLSEQLVEVRNALHIKTYAAHVLRSYLLRKYLLEGQRLSLKAKDAEVDLLDLLADTDSVVQQLREGLTPHSSVCGAGEVGEEVLAESYRQQALREAGETAQIQTGLRALDALTGGLWPGELTVVPARPSMGKSAFLLFLGLNAAFQGKHVALFSLEMNKGQIVTRLLSTLSGVEPDKIRFRGTTEAERARLEKAKERLKELHIYVDYCGGCTIEDIRAKVFTLHQKGMLDMFMIDYVSLIAYSGDNGGRLQETTDQAVGSITRKVKVMAEQLEVPAVLAVQMNRDIDRRPAPYYPVLSDIRNSGEIEQVADNVLFIHRSERYNILFDPKTQEDMRGVGQLFLSKARNGACGEVKFRYNPSLTRIVEYDQKLF